MKKIILFLLCLFPLLFLASCEKEAPMDEIENYTITVDQRADGSLDMKYHIEWLVLDDDKGSEPVTWVEIGVPNKYVEDVKFSGSDVRRAYYSDDDGDYIVCDLSNKFYSGETINIDFSFHLLRLYTFNDTTVKYKFTPGWFDKIEVKNITVKWNSENVKEASTDVIEDGYYVWNSSLDMGEKLKLTVKYDRADYPNLMTKKDYTDIIPIIIFITCAVLFVIICIVIVAYSKAHSDGYYSYRGFTGDVYFSHYWYFWLFHPAGRNSHGNKMYPPAPPSSGSHSSGGGGHSCACACACACAGGGRAGCARKDFYNPNLKIDEFVNKLED